MNVIITGATRGIGRAIALVMAAEGANLALCARNHDDLLKLKSILTSQYPHINIYIHSVDCSKKDDILSFADGALAHFGQIDVLVNNVGIFIPANILDEEDDLLQKHMDVNLFAPYFLYKKIGKNMRERKSGTIINICSVASKEAIIGAGSYCVTKAALLSLNNIMREELKKHDIKVTAILPGSTYTSSWEGVQIPKEEFVQAEDVAETVKTIIKISNGANIDEVTIKPLHGQI